MVTISSSSHRFAHTGIFYELMWPNNGPWGIAHAPPSLDDLLLRDELEAILPTWEVPTFYLQGGVFADYQPNDSVSLPHLCSEKMQHILEAHRHPTDLIEWLPVLVTDAPPPHSILDISSQSALPQFKWTMQSGGNEIEQADDQQASLGEIRQYFILHLLADLDVVNSSKSIMASDGPLSVVKPHFFLDKIGVHQIFRYRYGGDNVCLSNKMRLALVEGVCTGCHFWKIPSS